MAKRRSPASGPTVHEVLVRSALRAPHKTALICDDRTMTYREFLRNIDALGTLLTEQGLARGDRAAILTSDKALFLTAAYAVSKSGGIPVPLADGEALLAIEKMVKDAQPALFITTAGDLLEYPRLRQSIACPLFLIEEAVGTGDYSRSVLLRSTESVARAPAPAEAALILYTAGAGSERRGALLSHRNLIRVAENIIAFTGIDESICEFVAVPLYRSFGLSRCRSILFAGGTMVLTNGPINPVSMVQSILRHHCNALSLIPSGFASLFGHQETLIQRIGAQIRHMELGSSLMLPAQKAHVLELFPNARIVMHYGLTEAPRSAFLDFRESPEKLDTAGKAAPNVEIAVHGTDGELLGADGTGEVAVAGEHVMIGYWRNETLTSASMTRNGWFRTGDIGFLDEEGYLHVIGRKDEVIMMDGMKFSPEEVEESIREVFPGNELCVVGIPDPAGVVGEIPVLCYIARSGNTITASELSRLLSGRIDRNKIPRIVYRVEPSGNGETPLVRERVRQQFLEAFSHPEIEQK